MVASTNKVQLMLNSSQHVMSIGQPLENLLDAKKAVKLLIYVKQQR